MKLPTPRKGRGAVISPDGRFDAWRRETLDDGWWNDDEIPAPRTELIVDSAKTVITYNDSPDLPYDRSINPYRGCEHGCAYCFARPTHAYLGLSPGIDFETRLAWKADAAPARITNTILGPLKPDGSSEAWNIMFHSPSANASVAVNTFRGQLTCWAQAGSAGRMPDLKPGFVLDGAKLYAIAKQHGEKAIADGYFVMIGTAAAPSNRHATWNLNFSKADGKSSPPTILVDANTGAVEKVLK